MADIRPPNWPVANGGALVPQKGTGSARAEAQRAFFQAALTSQGVTAPATPAPTHTVAASTAQAAPRPRAPDLTIKMPDEEPTKFLRPGSIIDIRV
jgi:hypothetical protein